MSREGSQPRQLGSVLPGPDTAAHMVRGARAVLVILGTGSLGPLGLFFGASPGESVALRLALLALIQLLGAALVALLVPRWWLLALLTTWGPALLGSVALYVMLRHQTDFPRPRFLVLSLVAPPLIALAGGGMGRWWMRSRR